jgi:hypothetical protein
MERSVKRYLFTCGTKWVLGCSSSIHGVDQCTIVCHTVVGVQRHIELMEFAFPEQHILFERSRIPNDLVDGVSGREATWGIGCLLAPRRDDRGEAKDER